MNPASHIAFNYLKYFNYSIELTSAFKTAILPFMHNSKGVPVPRSVDDYIAYKGRLIGWTR